MYKLLAIFAIAMVSAGSSAKQESRSLKNWNYEKKFQKDAGYIVLLITLILFAGLRIGYNDTGTYLRNFVSSTISIEEFLAEPTSKNILKNPASEWYKVLLRQLTDDKTAYIMPTAVFTQYSIIRLLKKYSIEFNFSVMLLFTLGMYCFTLGALKQSIAMGILTFAIEAADKKKWVKFAVIVFIAMLFHTYAIVFIVVPFLRFKPWSTFTWLMAIGVVIVFMNLESVLGSIIDSSEEVGKKLYEEEILGGVGSNIFRILVYAVPVVISLIFRRKLFEDSQPIENIMVHLSILSFVCMAYGLVVNANQADRLATYYEIGTIVALPWMLKKAFDKDMHKLVKGCAYAAFFVYFVYKFQFASNFDSEYQSILSRYI